MGSFTKKLKKLAGKNPANKLFDAVGIKGNDPIRSVLDPAGQIGYKYANNQLHSAADVTDPGNFFHAAPPPPTTPYRGKSGGGLSPNPNSGGPTIDFSGNNGKYVQNPFIANALRSQTGAPPPSAQGMPQMGISPNVSFGMGDGSMPQPQAQPQKQIGDPRLRGGGRVMMF